MNTHIYDYRLKANTASEKFGNILKSLKIYPDLCTTLTGSINTQKFQKESQESKNCKGPCIISLIIIQISMKL